ncbi:Thiosulfate sulfurtransferase GlpE [Jeotgalicoccus saudimassiliensis]|uniref:Thiosulfate sulfurtransferase GlpE n=1 Tax=Jeotgalicoccus saudimassiliensis TaxID=1461582 RepID=A0A078MAH2_9STAP|nr:DsrE/DsrF/DrsH-like family protein [Jeotgalicoccus saudimassiliensis]CEA02437.1 Thiosulfate sulfurtransferase GlpE [Jeotgalicoccus saudimassiliensis]
MNKNNYHMNDVDELLNKGEYLLDVRETFEYEMGHVASAKHISLTVLEQRMDELPKDKTIYTYCKSGRRSQTAADLLNANGFEAISLEGGFSSYTGKFSNTDIEEVISPAETNSNIAEDRIKIAAHGLQCPGPLLKVNEVMSGLETGKQMEITVTDHGFCTDVEAWAKKHGHAVLKNEVSGENVTVVLEKKAPVQTEGHKMVETKDGATIVVFSGDMDKALASFIIASGARSMGKEVTMFFTFWGLNIIKDPKAPKRNKKGLDKMFSMMMPKSASKLPISKMNMLGAGSKMIQHVMKKKKVDALSEMIEKADKLGVKMIACTMSMDIMAVEKEELLSNVQFGGVGTYLGDAENGNLNLFI